VGDTTRRLPERGIENSDPGIESAQRELQIRIPCSGRSSAQVLDDISRGLTDALAQASDPLLVLEDLGRLQDSIMTLIKGLSRIVYKYPRPVTCWESAGFAEAFLTVMDAAESPAPARVDDLEPPYGSD
jgi:hypothetical protein